LCFWKPTRLRGAFTRGLALELFAIKGRDDFNWRDDVRGALGQIFHRNPQFIVPPASADGLNWKTRRVFVVYSPS